MKQHKGLTGPQKHFTDGGNYGKIFDIYPGNKIIPILVKYCSACPKICKKCKVVCCNISQFNWNSDLAGCILQGGQRLHFVAKVL